MIKLGRQLAHISSLLLDRKIQIRGKEYKFKCINLEYRRLPPVANGYVPQFFLEVVASRRETNEDREWLHAFDFNEIEKIS